jgi:hypothetical protein
VPARRWRTGSGDAVGDEVGNVGMAAAGGGTVLVCGSRGASHRTMSRMPAATSRVTSMRVLMEKISP